MRKAEIARRIHQQTGLSEKEAAKLLDGILEILAATLREGNPITIPGFGKFTVRGKLSRKGWNFKAGESLIITARRVVTFRPSALLTTDVNAVQKAPISVLA